MAKKQEFGKDGNATFNDYLWQNCNKRNPNEWMWWVQSNAPQKKMSERKQEILDKLAEKGEDGEFCNRFDDAVIKKMLKDGTVKLSRHGHSGGRGKNYTKVYLTDIQPKAEEKPVSKPFATRHADLEEAGLSYRGKNRGNKRKIKKTVKWTKEREQKHLMDCIRGTEDPKITEQLGKTKTRVKKIVIEKDV